MEHKHPETVEMEDIEKELDRAATVSDSHALACYNAEAGRTNYEESGYCEYEGKCKHKHRVYEKGPRGGMRKTDSFMCQGAL